MITAKDYQEFVVSCVIGETVEEYTPLRAAAELGEECLEFLLVDDDDEEAIIKELGDILFWIAYLHDLTGLELVYPDVVVDEGFDFADVLEAFKDVIGTIKRLYRDKNYSKFYKLKQLLPVVAHKFAELCHDEFSSIQEVAQVNYLKLSDRLKRNVLQGEGDNR